MAVVDIARMPFDTDNSCTGESSPQPLTKKRSYLGVRVTG
jgi:hypothetical protein